MANSQKPPPGFGGAADPGLPLGDSVPIGRESLLTANDVAIDQLRGQLQALEQRAAAHESDIKKIIAACIGYEQALATARSHIDALARREMLQGMWEKALNLATQVKTVTDSTDGVVQRAEKFHALLLRDLPAAIPINTQSIGNAHDDDPADLPAPKGPTVN